MVSYTHTHTHTLILLLLTAGGLGTEMGLVSMLRAGEGDGGLNHHFLSLRASDCAMGRSKKNSYQSEEVK